MTNVGIRNDKNYFENDSIYDQNLLWMAGCSTDSFQIDWIYLYCGWLFKDKGFFDIPICLDEFWCTTKDYWSFSSYFDFLHRFKGSNPIRI